MSSCWYVHTEQCDDSNSFPRAGLCISAGLSDRRASAVLFRSGITKVSTSGGEVNAGVRAREGKSSASLVATQSICILAVEEEVPCCSGPSKKLSPHRPNQSSGAPSRPLPALPQQVPESSLGGLAACYHARHGDTCL